MEILEIIWVDSCASNHSWLLIEDINKWKDVEPLLIHTFGIKVQEDENYVVIAQNYAFDPEQCCNLMSIPKGCIKETIIIRDIQNTL